MADTASSILLLRLQSTGSNVNLWGGYINVALQTLERASKGYQAYPVTGDATISWTNYSATNDYSVAVVKATGSPTASWTHTLPTYQMFFTLWNASGQTGTLKNSGGTGISVPNGRRALAFGDGVDIRDAAPNWLSSYATTLTNAGDIVVKATLESAIATASLPATAGTVLNSAADTTAGYHASKHTVSYSSATTTQLSGLLSAQYATSGAGGDERLALTFAPGYVGGFLPGGIQASQFTPVVGREYTCNFTSSSWTVNLSGMTTPQLEQKIKLNCYGNYPAFLLGTVNGQTNLVLDAGFSGELTYTGASWGWN